MGKRQLKEVEFTVMDRRTKKEKAITIWYKLSKEELHFIHPALINWAARTNKITAQLMYVNKSK